MTSIIRVRERYTVFTRMKRAAAQTLSSMSMLEWQELVREGDDMLATALISLLALIGGGLVAGACINVLLQLEEIDTPL